MTLELTLALQPATVLLVVVPLALVLCVVVFHFALKVKLACAHKCMHTCSACTRAVDAPLQALMRAHQHVRINTHVCGSSVCSVHSCQSHEYLTVSKPSRELA